MSFRLAVMATAVVSAISVIARTCDVVLAIGNGLEMVRMNCRMRRVEFGAVRLAMRSS